MSKIKLAGHVTINADEAATQVWAFLGRRGSGKTYAAGVLVEGLLSNDEQVVILDPVGVWYGLRLLADGKTKSDFNVPVFGGKRGDVALTETAGALVASVLVETGTSAVLDVSQMRKGARKRFVTELLEELFTLKKAADEPRPLHLVLEEARVFCPQKPQKGEERMLGAVEDVVRQGRSAGLGCTLIDQRPQSVNKDVLNQAAVLVALQQGGAHECKAIAEWVRENATAGETSWLDTLPKLEVGEAFVWSPQWLRLFVRTHIAQKNSFDASATPTLKKAQRAAPPAPLDKDAIDALRSAMAEVETEAKANDPKRLRAEIARLESALELAKRNPAIPAAADALDEAKRLRARVAEVEAQLERGTDHAARAHLRALAGMTNDPAIPLSDVVEKIAERLRAANAHSARLVNELERVKLALGGVQSLLEAALTGFKRIEVQVPTPAPPAVWDKAARANTHRLFDPANQARRDLSTKSGLKKGARAMLQALAMRDPIPLTRDQLGTLAGLSPNSGTFSDYLSSLRTGGYVEDRDTPHSKALGITPAGREVAGDVPRHTSRGEVLALWFTKIKKAGARRMLQVLVDHPTGVSRGALADGAQISASSGTFSDYLSILRRNGLLVEEGGVLRPARELRAGLAA